MTSDGAPAPGVHAYARLESGVHAISPGQAVETIRAPREANPESPLVWLDIVDPGVEEATFLRDECGFHPLAVDDCLRGRQRPKLERYPGTFFLVFYVAAVNERRGRLALEEIHLFLGAHFLVTVHRHRRPEVGEIVARWRSAPDRLPNAGSLAHALLDRIVDDYFPVLEQIGERVESIESAVFDRLETAKMQQILWLRHQLVHFRRILAPERDAISTLLRRELPFEDAELIPYLHDVHDHLIRATEHIDALRELLSATMEAQMTIASNTLNQTMRMLTAWSIVLMSMALIAGVYGMNFVFMPELAWRWGYAGAIALMGTIGVVLLSYFRRRGWI